MILVLISSCKVTTLYIRNRPDPLNVNPILTPNPVQILDKLKPYPTSTLSVGLHWSCFRESKSWIHALCLKNGACHLHRHITIVVDRAVYRIFGCTSGEDIQFVRSVLDLPCLGTCIKRDLWGFWTHFLTVSRGLPCWDMSFDSVYLHIVLY